MIQWYPGHMAKARKALALALPRQDVVIEVLDARAPRSSANPVLSELRGDKPCVKVLAKSDLADPRVTEAWLAQLADASSAAIATSTLPGTKAKVLDLCKRVSRRTPTERGRPTRIMIVGVPNVGKSTLINTLVGRKVAKVGDEPAVTKARQEVVLEGGLVLSDNPGILWPKLDDEDVAYRLAFMGSLPDVAMDFEDVADHVGAYLLARYPALLVRRYSLAELPASPVALLEAIGRRRGCIRSGGVIDTHKAADHLIHDFRSGALGRVTLEEP
jgi:ribosome biogenesis GTPase A